MDVGDKNIKFKNYLLRTLKKTQTKHHITTLKKDEPLAYTCVFSRAGASAKIFEAETRRDIDVTRPRL